MAANIFVEVLHGNGDSIITTGTNNLRTRVGLHSPYHSYNKDTIRQAPLCAALQNTFANQLDGGTRIYLRGHGGWEFPPTLGGLEAEWWATFLVANGLNVQPRVISITGCNAGRAPQCGEPASLDSINLEFSDIKQIGADLLANADSSFAGRFVAALCVHPNMQNVPVTARTYSNSVDDDGHKQVVIGPDHLVKPAMPGAYSKTKLVFFNDQNGNRSVEWVNRQAKKY